MSCTHSALPPSHDGDCSIGWSRPDVRRSTPTRSISVRSRRRVAGHRDAPVAYCARRTVLDKLLVDAAAEAGAEVREGFTVEEVLVEDGRVVGIKGRSKGGEPVTERAKVVVGADGRYSLVAEAVRPEQYNERPPLLCRLLHLLERSADGRPVRNLHPRPTADSRRRRRTTA